MANCRPVLQILLQRNRAILQQVSKSDADRFRTDLQLPRSASLSTRLVKRNGSAVSVALKRSMSTLVPGLGGGSRSASDSMLIKKRHNKSNTVTVLVIIGK